MDKETRLIEAQQKVRARYHPAPSKHVQDEKLVLTAMSMIKHRFNHPVSPKQVLSFIRENGGQHSIKRTRTALRRLRQKGMLTFDKRTGKFAMAEFHDNLLGKLILSEFQQQYLTGGRI